MKNKSKTVLAVACTLLLMGCSVLGTIAYLTDRESVANTFTVGNVDIKLDEALVTPDGVPETDAQGNVIRQEEGNEYHLVPGMTYVKDPTVTVLKNSQPSYVRLVVTIHRAQALKTIFGDDFLPRNYVTGWDEEIWRCTAVREDTEADTITYEFRYHQIVDVYGAMENVVLEPLFTGFTLPGEVTGEQLKTLYDPEDPESGFKIAVEGHAIQAATFEADEDAGLTAEDVAWIAFDAQNTPEGH